MNYMIYEKYVTYERFRIYIYIWVLNITDFTDQPGEEDF